MKTTLLAILALSGIFAQADCIKYYNELYKKDVAEADAHNQGVFNEQHAEMITSVGGGPVAGAVVGAGIGAGSGSVSTIPGMVVGGAGGAVAGFMVGTVGFVSSNSYPDVVRAQTSNLEVVQMFQSAMASEDTLSLHSMNAKLRDDFNIQVGYSQMLLALRTINGTCDENGNDRLNRFGIYQVLVDQLRADGALQ